uniref:Transcription factor 25 n=1 Tax=Otus sunia TaxID=257818 RepID=A0A8C8BR03_9STRI
SPGIQLGKLRASSRGREPDQRACFLSHSKNNDGSLCHNCLLFACAYLKEDNDLEDIDSLLEKIEDTSGLSQQTQSGIIADSRPLLYVEHRNLNPENELKRYFGARAVLGDQRPRQRQRQYVRSTWLTAPKNTWPRYSKTGIAMQLVDTRRGVQHFTFEHHREYQQVQFKFLDAVESMDPNNIVLLLQMNPYHVDSLLQLSDVCRMQEDQEMARDLIVARGCFSPNLGAKPCCCSPRRAFFLALFKHLMFLEKRGCPRTALEFCKLILSLDPENDPLCVLLLIDFLSLRAREYTFLTRIFQEWESHRNLSQLPNFAFSVPLAYFFLSQQEERSELEISQARERAARLIQLALIMFPSVLMPLLDRCSVQPDARVTSHPFFGLNAQISQPPALNQLTSLYVGRTHSLWKDPAVMAWLETHVHEVLRMVDARDPLVEDSEHKRKMRYQSAPRNIYRHVILSEMKEATAALPLEVTSQPVMGFDPLPPLDSIISYTRPERYFLHPWFPRWHSRRVPGAPSAPGLAARGRSEPTSSSISEEEQPGLWCSPTGRAYRQDWSCRFSIVVTVHSGSSSQPLRQRPLEKTLKKKKSFDCLTEVVWGKYRFKRSRGAACTCLTC